MTRFSELEKIFELPPEGVHTATCVQWVDRGLQELKYGPNGQYSFRFELLDTKMENDEPFIVFHTVLNTSLNSPKSKHSKLFHEMCNALTGMEVSGARHQTRPRRYKSDHIGKRLAGKLHESATRTWK